MLVLGAQCPWTLFMEPAALITRQIAPDLVRAAAHRPPLTPLAKDSVSGGRLGCLDHSSHFLKHFLVVKLMHFHFAFVTWLQRGFDQPW